MEVEVTPDAPALAAHGADLAAEILERAIKARGLAGAAFSGGRTPTLLFAELARHDLPWERVHVFQVDERVAPDGHPDRNLSALRAALLDHVPANAHPMPVTEADLSHAARGYAELLGRSAAAYLTLSTWAWVMTGTPRRGHRATRWSTRRGMLPS